MVLDHADPAGQHAVIQKKLLGPAGPKVKKPLALLVLNHADPAGQHAATQEHYEFVGAFTCAAGTTLWGRTGGTDIG